MMDNPKYEKLLYGEVSAMTFFNHMGRPLELLLGRADLHPRLLNGGDYPMPVSKDLRGRNLVLHELAQKVIRQRSFAPAETR